MRKEGRPRQGTGKTQLAKTRFYCSLGRILPSDVTYGTTKSEEKTIVEVAESGGLVEGFQKLSSRYELWVTLIFNFLWTREGEVEVFYRFYIKSFIFGTYLLLE